MRQLLVLGLLVLTLTPGKGFAHAVGVAVKLVGATARVEVYFDDDSPGVKAKVEVRNADENVIAKGVADDQGKWSFSAPPPGKYMVHVDAGAGHRAKKRFTVPDPSQPVAPKESPAEPETMQIPPTASKSIVDGPSRAEFTSFPWL